MSAIALGGLVLAFGESLDLGTGEYTALAALAVVLSPLASAIGNIATKKRMQGLDPLVMNGWAMVTRRRAAARGQRPDRGLGRDDLVVHAIGSIVYLAAFGTGFTFVTLTVLLRELPAVTVSFISMIIPFGALALGAVFRDETGDRAGRRRRAAGGGRDRGRAVPRFGEDALMPSIVVLGARNLGGAILAHHLQAGWQRRGGRALAGDARDRPRRGRAAAGGRRVATRSRCATRSSAPAPSSARST